MHLGIKYAEVVEDGYEEIQDKLEDYLEKRLSPDYMYSGRTNVAVKFQYRGIEVDLLLSPFWETRRDYYDAMQQIKVPEDRFKWYKVLYHTYTRND